MYLWKLHRLEHENFSCFYKKMTGLECRKLI
jgi:hypothetical protein